MQGAHSRRTRIGATVVAAAMAAATWAAVGAAPAGAVPAFAFARLAGADRYATAGAVATDSFNLGADTVIMATGENFPDALAGNFLAGVRNAPILLTTRDAPVPPATLAALVTLKTRNVVLLGLTAAISQGVQDALAATASTAAGGGNLVVSRLGGLTRYETMRAILADAGAASVGTAGGRKTAFVASGEAFPDALAVGPASFARKYPTILTTPNSLSTAASDSLTALGIQQVIIAGGTVAVSAATELAVQALGIPTLTRFSGATRSGTARIAADFAVNNLAFRNNHFNVATGENVRLGVDALAGGPHGGRELAVNLITNSSVDIGATPQFAGARSATLAGGHVFGGTAALADDILNQIAAAAQGQGTPPAAPTIVGLTPSAGPSGGGTPVTITGTNLASTSVVDFCGVSTTTFTATDTTVVATSPPRPNGPCFVNVSAAGGSAGVTFTYTGGPTITSISPTGGPLTAGTTFTITGTNLGATTSVSFCGSAATSLMITSTTVTGQAPAGTAGPCTVVLTTPGGTAVVNYAYGSTATVTTISPLSGPVTGGTGFTITGTNLGGTTMVDFCGAAATSVSATPTTVTGITPARPAGACTVTVFAPGGTVTTTFTYGTAPVVTTITPASGPTTGGTVVTLAGANLGGATGVTFCGDPATAVTVVTATTVTATSPPRAAGVCPVVVTTPGGTSAPVSFTYGAAPTVASISPTSGPSSGGTSFTITGTNLAGTTSVTFCGSAAGGLASTPMTVTGTTPARAAGACTVTVTTPSGSTTSTFSFTFTDAPTVAGISPTSGGMLGGVPYTITGTNLAGTTSVNFCGTNDVGFTATATTITGSTPGRLLGFGACTVTVTTPSGSAQTTFIYTLL